MKKFIFLFAFILFIHNTNAQNKRVNSIGITIPVIWNKSNGVYYRLGKRYEPNGKSKSNGININFTRNVYKNFYAIGGVGYYKQRFNVIRPFDFESLTNFLFSTKSYHYDNLQLLFGIGYNKKIKKDLYFNTNISYQQFLSYTQKYYLKYGNVDSSQINHFSKNIGKSININLGFEKNLNEKISIGLEIVSPIYIKWNDDKTFIEYTYSGDTQKIA
jgi:hypothetical protein